MAAVVAVSADEEVRSASGWASSLSVKSSSDYMYIVQTPRLQTTTFFFYFFYFYFFYFFIRHVPSTPGAWGSTR